MEWKNWKGYGVIKRSWWEVKVRAINNGQVSKNPCRWIHWLKIPASLSSLFFYLKYNLITPLSFLETTMMPKEGEMYDVIEWHFCCFYGLMRVTRKRIILVMEPKISTLRACSPHSWPNCTWSHHTQDFFSFLIQISLIYYVLTSINLGPRSYNARKRNVHTAHGPSLCLALLVK